MLAPYVRALHVHCYRMLGSLDEADQVVQEVQVRAGNGQSEFDGRVPLAYWLYRIATAECLKLVHAQGRQPVADGEPGYLQPYPDRLLDELAGPSAADGGDPAASVDHRETVALAFIIAMQRLPATQRAALILCDVLGFDTREAPVLLDTTITALDSLLELARVAMARAYPAQPTQETVRRALARFVEAWQARDFSAMAAMVSRDSRLAVPVGQDELRGRKALLDYFSSLPEGGRLIPTRANGQPAVAIYRPASQGGREGYGLLVLAIDAVETALIHTIISFPDARLFQAFDLPMNLSA